MKAIRLSPRSAWPFVEHVWGLASGLYRTPVGATARKPFELLVLEELVNEGPGCEDLFAEHLLHLNPYVSAYCLLGLEHLNSRQVKILPVELLERKDPLIIHAGCFVYSQLLGDFARQVSDAAISSGS